MKKNSTTNKNLNKNASILRLDPKDLSFSLTLLMILYLILLMSQLLVLLKTFRMIIKQSLLKLLKKVYLMNKLLKIHMIYLHLVSLFLLKLPHVDGMKLTHLLMKEKLNLIKLTLLKQIMTTY